MKRTRRARWWVVLVALFAFFIAPALALAGPRSGGSFGGRTGFRSGGGSFSGGGRGYSGGGRSYGGGSHFIFMPGWGFGGYGYGGGIGIFGTLVILAVGGLAVAAVVRAVRRSRAGGGGYSAYGSGYDDDSDYGPAALPDRAFLYKLQIALGRSARGVQDRLAEFAAQGDTSSEAGLGALLQQTSLELLRQKDSIRYAHAEGKGPMSLTNAETAMNALTMGERSRFQVERVRAADGRVQKSTAAAEEGKEALELVVVTMVVATRTALPAFKKGVTTPAELANVLSELGTVVPAGLLGLEVVWTPADPNDSMTETDVMTTYPELRSF